MSSRNDASVDSRPDLTTANTQGGRSVPRGGVLPGERALTPDLARGAMLLLIVLSNTGFHLWAAEHGPSGWHPVDGSTADRVVQFLMITMLDLRVYPLFAFLFGYGMMRLFLRQTAAGATPRDAVRLLRRRSMLLLVVGFAHAALLMAGDIVGAYGVASLILGWLFLRRRDRTLVVWSAVLAVAMVALSADGLWAVATGDLGRLGDPTTPPSTLAYAAGEPDPVAAAGTRLTTWMFVTLGGGVFGVSIHLVMLLGFWAARRRMLEEPQRHVRLLRWTAAVGVSVGWLGGSPAALTHVGAVDVPAVAISEGGALQVLQDVTGVAGGLGYVALFALVGHQLSGRTRYRRAVCAVAAVGKRSLSAYLTHSLLFSPALAAWGLGWGAALGSATMAVFAVGVWLVTVAAAYALERAGRRGPVEALLRRLMYGVADRQHSQVSRAAAPAGSGRLDP